MVHGTSIWVHESKSGWSLSCEVAQRERPSPLLAMNPVWLLLVLVGAVSSAFVVPSQISPGCLWCLSSIHAVLVTLLLDHGYELLPDTTYSQRRLGMWVRHQIAPLQHP